MTQREIKFRAWNKENKKWIKNNYYLDLDGIAFSLCFHSCECGTGGEHQEEVGNVELMQYTGLKDKNGLQEVYEGDIIDEYGNIKGNIYEMDAGETDFIIQGFGDKNWGATYKEAVGRGCTDTQRYADTDEVWKLE